MKIDTSLEPKNWWAQAASACTARMFHCLAYRAAPAGLVGLPTPSAFAASGSEVAGMSSSRDSSASTAWTPGEPASVAGAEPTRPLTVASPVPGEIHSTVPPSAATRSAKSAGTAPLKDTMSRPVSDVVTSALVASKRGARVGPATRGSSTQAATSAKGRERCKQSHGGHGCWLR